jgi:hypothetical protein
MESNIFKLVLGNKVNIPVASGCIEIHPNILEGENSENRFPFRFAILIPLIYSYKQRRIVERPV